jgi:hypothetical protein
MTRELLDKRHVSPIQHVPDKTNAAGHGARSAEYGAGVVARGAGHGLSNRHVSTLVKISKGSIYTGLPYAPERSMKLVLDGWVNPWSPEGWHHPRRFTLMYQGVGSFESCNGVRLFGDDLGYHELECLDDGAFEHRMLFASDAELIVRFEDLQLRYIDLQEPVV